MLGEYFKLAFKNLSKRKLRTYLTMIGVFIGIASVIALIGLGQGLRVAITSQFGFMGTDVLSVQAAGMNFGPPGTGVVTPLTKDLEAKINKIQGVEEVFLRYIQTASMEFNNKQNIVFTTSVPEGQKRKAFETMANLKAEQGRLLRDGDDNKVLLGNDFKKKDSFGRGIISGDKIIINNKRFEVVGILEKKGSFIFDMAVFVNENIIISELGKDEDEINVIAVKVINEKVINEVKESLEKLLRKERGVKKGEEDFTVQTPQKALETLDSTLYAVQLFITIIAVISLLVGGIGIMNTMYTAVLERTKEIGIMKSVGARNSTIFTLFAIESGFMGLVGGLIGIIIGLGLAFGLSAIGRIFLGSELIQAQVSLGLMLSTLAFSFILGTLFGVLPAMRASKLNPVDSLRNIK